MTGVTDHPEYRALVARMRENPDCDVTRLVAADWLEEHGEGAWARFARWGGEVELYSYGLPPWYGLGQQQPAGTVKALRPLLPPPRSSGSRFRAFFRRGFLFGLLAPADWWLEHGDAVYATQPVTLVDLTTYHLGLGPRDEAVRNLSARWPGVEFTLPPEVVFRGSADGGFSVPPEFVGGLTAPD